VILEEVESLRRLVDEFSEFARLPRRIAHEVKNPLSPIRLAVENLRRVREKAPEQFDRALAEETAVILEEVESLRRLVDEFSEFARLPRPQPVSCDPSSLVRQALAVLQARIDAHGVSVETSFEGAPGRIVADPEQIGRVLKNVLGNALDALEGAKDRRLSVTLGREGDARAWLVVEVRDSGIGLTAEGRRRIFEPYFTTRSEQGGTGLGMAIVHRIVTEHGGMIEAQGAPAQGATIRIRLPLAGPPQERV
jgi:two-component system nitrogen regulation sensor histidine kinase NtrY